MAELFEALDGDPAVDAEISGAAFVQAMLDAESALIRALVHTGIAPSDAADSLAKVSSQFSIEPEDLGARAVASGNPVVPVVHDLRAAVPENAAHWIHYGATSQDIMDTAFMLVIKRALIPITQALDRAAATAADLAQQHRESLMIARTLGQHALPTTFGLKAAGWCAGLDRAARGLRDLPSSTLAAQLGGPVGSLGAYGDRGLAVAARFAVETELADPGFPWHTERSRIHRIATAFGSATAAAGKVATDVLWLSQSDVGEVTEAGDSGHGASSAMPHKRNPSRAVLVMSAARRTPGLVGTILASGVHEHERAVGSWHAEWQPLRELVHLAGGAAARVADLLANLDVHTERMRSNLDAFLEAPAATESLGDGVRNPESLLGQTQSLIDRILAAHRTGTA